MHPNLKRGFRSGILSGIIVGIILGVVFALFGYLFLYIPITNQNQIGGMNIMESGPNEKEILITPIINSLIYLPIFYFIISIITSILLSFFSLKFKLSYLNIFATYFLIFIFVLSLISYKALLAMSYVLGIISSAPILVQILIGSFIFSLCGSISFFYFWKKFEPKKQNFKRSSNENPSDRTKEMGKNVFRRNLSVL